jgi:hypothetical protein
MGADEVATLQALKTHRREVVDPAIAAHARVEAECEPIMEEAITHLGLPE